MMDPTKARFDRAINELKKTNSIPDGTPIVKGPGGYVVDIYGSSASASTAKRRERLGLNDNTKEWKRGEPIPKTPLPCKHEKTFHKNGSTDNQGRYGFHNTKSNSKLTPMTIKQMRSITSIKKENKHIYPGTSVNIVPIIMTPDGVQTYIDKINKKNQMISHDEAGTHEYEDPHYCCEKSPCDMKLKRTHSDGSSDYRWGLHVLAIDYDKLISAKHRVMQNCESIIGPSWHSEDIKKWHNNWKNGNKKKKVPFPIHGHDLDLIRDSNVTGYFRSFKEKYEHELHIGKRLYILVNLFGKDELKPGEQPNEYHIESLQLPRGKVDDADIAEAGITSQKRHASQETLIKCAKICACRETFEETDRTIDIKVNDTNLKLIADLQQNHNRVVRTMVFCYENPLDIEKITHYSC